MPAAGAAAALFLLAASLQPAAMPPASAQSPPVVAAPGLDAAALAALDIRPGPTASRELPGWAPPRVVLVPKNLAGEIPALREIAADAEFVVPTDDASLLALAPRVDVSLDECDAQFLAAASRLRWVQSLSAGVDDCMAAPSVREGRVTLTAMQGTNSPAVADHAMALVLALSRNLGPSRDAQPRGEWRRVPEELASLRTLQGRTLLLVGLGHIGRAVAQRAAAFGMHVVATRGRGAVAGAPPFVEEVGGPGDLLRLAARADVVVNVAPLTPATTGIFDAPFFAALPPRALFVNVGRGDSVNQAALLAALQSGRLGGAGLDVTSPEPLPPDHPLWRAPRTLITPHIAGGGSDFALRRAVLRENLRRYVAGEPLLSVVDAARGY
jgi:phosphoglycerate dehydrogenase-like enzyme